MRCGAVVRAVGSLGGGRGRGNGTARREALATCARAVAPGSLVFLVSLASARGQAVEHLIDGGFTGGSDVIAADIDLDGRPDIIGASYYSDVVSWWRNLGAEQWERQIGR